MRNPRSLGRWLSWWLAVQTLIGLGLVCVVVYAATSLNFSARQAEELRHKQDVIRHLVREIATPEELPSLRHKLDDFFIGGYGMGTDQPDITLQQDIGGEIQDITYNIRFKHGGLWFGYTPRQYKMGHLYTSLKVGWGKAQLLNQDFDTPRDRIFVLTPEVGAEVNLTNWFKLGFTGGYRWVNGISRLPTLDDSDFSSPTGTITFRFGGFGDGWEWD